MVIMIVEMMMMKIMMKKVMRMKMMIMNNNDDLKILTIISFVDQYLLLQDFPH